LDLTNKIFKR